MAREVTTITVKGVVKGNVVVLDEKTPLPEGATVEVRVVEPVSSHEDPFERILAHRVLNAGLRVRMDEIIEEDRQEREEWPDRWLSPDPVR